MKLLILGGTAFVGRHIAEAALARGDEVTLFHRGRTRVPAFDKVETLLGDRDGDLSALAGSRTWDAVVDTSAYLPRVADASSRLLADRAGIYAFLSTVSVYKDFSQVGITEQTPRAVIKEPLPDTVSNETYGALKARCERAAAAHFPGRLLIVRPGILIGPHDYTGRFAYWVRRVAEGGEMLAPGRPGSPLQVLDARDLAAFVLDRIDARDSVIYNATGPAEPLSWVGLFEDCEAATGVPVRMHWVEDERLSAAGVTGADLPLWIPAGPATAGFYTVSSAKAVAVGLRHRPLAESIADVLASAQGKAGMPRTREAELLRRFTGV